MTKWFIKGNKRAYDKLKYKTDLSSIQKRLLSNRDITDPVSLDLFVDPKLHKLHDPFLMSDMEEALTIIMDSISRGDSIRIIGDYDQDGNSATMTLLEGLSPYTDRLSYAIPDRIEDGYGLNENLVEKAKADGVSLIITCDNGIAAFDAVRRAHEEGMKIIVTDHHQVPKDERGEDRIVEADAILNPKQKRCSYPFKELCGAGVSFKLIQALYQEADGDEDYLFDLLQYVAMGTVCDIVDLVDENRIFVIEGLKRINEDPKQGIKALLRASSWEREVTTYTLGFVLGPCINAGGRLSTADLGIELFLQRDEDRVDKIAQSLVSLNNERKDMTEKGTKDALDKVEKKDLLKFSIIVIYLEGVHESLCGIISGRIKDRFHRPVIVFTDSHEEGILKGSGRSIEEYDMFRELSKLKDYFTSFGGHEMAAGLSIKREDLGDFAKDLQKKSTLTEDDLEKKLDIDAVLSLRQVSYDLIEDIEALAPFGKGNPSPLFACKDCLIEDMRLVGKEKNVLKLKLFKDVSIEGIIFSCQEDLSYLNKKFSHDIRGAIEEKRAYIDICYQPQINEFQGKKSLQLKIKEIR